MKRLILFLVITMTGVSFGGVNMKAQKFIETIREQRDGFSFDKPWRLEETSVGVVVPVLRKHKTERDYIMLSEANQIKIEDTGQIDYVYVKNDEKTPVLISRGDIFRGKTQERAAIHDCIVMPGSGLRVPVRCVHQTKGIVHGSAMSFGGKTGYAIDLSSQWRAWETVSCYTTSYASSVCDSISVRGGNVTLTSDVMASSDDLVSTIDNMSATMQEVFKKIPYIKNQVGAIFLKENKLIGMDVFDVPLSWDAVKKAVVEKEGASFIEKDSTSIFEFREDRVVDFLGKQLSVDFEEKVIFDREYQVIELRSESLLGECIQYKDKIIHLTLWKK